MDKKSCPKGYKRVGSRCFARIHPVSILILKESFNNSLSKLTHYLRSKNV